MESIQNATKLSNEIKYYLQQMIKHRFGIMLFVGDNGTGKTYASKCIYNAINPYGASEGRDPDIIIYYKQGELKLEYQRRMKKYGEVYTFLEELRKTKFLILDEMGLQEEITPGFLEFLYLVIDHRYDNRKILGTVISTNLNLDGIEVVYGKAFKSRVCSNFIINFEGEDLRESEQKLVGFKDIQDKFYSY